MVVKQVLNLKGWRKLDAWGFKVPVPHDQDQFNAF